VIDLEKKVFVNDVCLDLATIGMGNPWGIKCSKDGKFMAIAHAGSNDLSVIKYPPFIDTVIARSSRGVDMQKDFTSMLKSRQRVPVKTKGPRELAIIGNKIYTAGYFDDEAARMERFNVVWDDDIRSTTYQIGESQKWTGLRHGENNFYDASLCYQKWQSCHSCHPFTRPDALNWILGGGAVTTPKNAKSMLYSWWTPPTTWTGRRGHAESSIKAGIQLELFQSPSDELADPLDTLFMYLKPMPSPRLDKGRLSEAAMRGKAIFYNRNKVDCIICHPPPLFTDNLGWNTTLPDPYDANPTWITPNLREAWRTGPYGHIGGQWGIREILEIKGHSTNYLNLDLQEMDDLVEYVESL
jgi:cytochrome c peroxidase